MKNQKTSPLEHLFLLPGFNTWLIIYKDFCIVKICTSDVNLKQLSEMSRVRIEKINISHFKSPYEIYFPSCEFLRVNTYDVSMKKYLELDEIDKIVLFFVKDFQQLTLTITRLYRNKRLYLIHPEQNHLTFIHGKQVILFISRAHIGKFSS